MKVDYQILACMCKIGEQIEVSSVLNSWLWVLTYKIQLPSLSSEDDAIEKIY